MNQPFDAIELHERAEGLDLRYRNFELGAGGVLVFGLAPRVGDERATAQPDLTAFVDLDDLDLDAIAVPEQVAHASACVVRRLGLVHEPFEVLGFG